MNPTHKPLTILTIRQNSSVGLRGLKVSNTKEFFKDVYAKALALRPVKLLILTLFVLYIAGALYGCSQLREGLDRAKLTLDVSYAKDFFQADDKYFKSFPYRVQVRTRQVISLTIHRKVKRIDPGHCRVGDHLSA